METQSIIKTISLVMRDLAKKGIGKDQKISFGATKYNYRGIDDIHNSLAPVLAEHGLVIMPEIIESDIKAAQTKNGIQEQIHVKMKYHFYHIHNDQTVTAILPSEAFDTSDKAIAKALSMAYKYMAIQVFSIPVVGAEDGDASRPDAADPLRPIKDRIQKLYASCPDHPIKTWMEQSENDFRTKTDAKFLNNLESKLNEIVGVTK